MKPIFMKHKKYSPDQIIATPRNISWRRRLFWRRHRRTSRPTTWSDRAHSIAGEPPKPVRQDESKRRKAIERTRK